MRYIVTNLRLESSVHRAVKERAIRRRVPASVIFREAIERYLASDELSRERYDEAWEELLRLTGAVKRRGRRHTGSTDLDEVLYGPRRRGTR